MTGLRNRNQDLELRMILDNSVNPKTPAKMPSPFPRDDRKMGFALNERP